MKTSRMSNVDRIATGLGPAGRNAMAYVDQERHAGRPLMLQTYRPCGHTPQCPVVIVQHGVLRNGDAYRDFWVPAADRHQLLIVAPTFSDAAWPGVESYNNGRVFRTDGKPRPVADWTYALVGQLIRDLIAAGISDGRNIYLFGHSAGGQFVHRLMSSQPHAPFKAVTAGNPGWYSLPTFERPFPEGMDGVGLTEAHLHKLLACPMTILAGARDIATDDPHLPSEPAAMRQGPHRLARAHHYFEYGRQQAGRHGLPFGWNLQVVPGIGHDGRAMSAVCASLWFEGRMPCAEELARLAGQQVA